MPCARGSDAVAVSGNVIAIIPGTPSTPSIDCIVTSHRIPVGSEFNRKPEVTQELAFPNDVFLVDSTIRSLQSTSSGSGHTVDDLVEIGVALDRVGVRELIVNVTWRDGLEAIEGLKSRGVECAIVGTFGAGRANWRTLTSDAVRAGADQICFESAESVDAFRTVVDFSRNLGAEVSHGFAEDHTYDEIVALSQAAAELGCPSLSFHDSYFRFAITPEAMKAFIRSILRDVPDAPPLYVHLSNFFGHATMTAVAGLAAGASAVDVCANATGHHCGHTSLAEVALVLEYMYGVKTGIALDRLRELALLLEERTGVPTPIMRPLVGEYAFSGDGSTWAAGALLPSGKRLHSTFPFDPAAVGSAERIVWSDRTLTDNAIAAKLTSMGLDPERGTLANIRSRVREQIVARQYPCWLTDDEFAALLRSLVVTAA